MNKVVRMVFGSHMYGLNTPNSDQDFKGIYLPSLRGLLLGNYAKHISHSTGDDLSKNTKDDVDDDWYALPEFIKLAVKGETVALDMLHVNDELSKTEVDKEFGWIWQELVANRDKFYTKNLKAYMGYVKRQAAKYGLKGSRIAAMREAIAVLETANEDLTLSQIWEYLPESEFAKRTEKAGANGRVESFYEVNGKMFQATNGVGYVLHRIRTALNSYGDRAKQAEMNNGVDWKAVSHALRAGYQLRSVLVNGSFSYPLAETDFLKRVKAGALDYSSVVAPALEELVEEVESLVEASSLPDNVDEDYWNDWLVYVYDTALITPEYPGW